jgi:hypothetical protein
MPKGSEIPDKTQVQLLSACDFMARLLHGVLAAWQAESAPYQAKRWQRPQNSASVFYRCAPLETVLLLGSTAD